MDENSTITFSLKAVKEEEMRKSLTAIYNAFIEKGESSTVNPINQIVGYILSEDPTYITKHNNARAIARKLDRDELLAALVRSYLKL